MRNPCFLLFSGTLAQVIVAAEAPRPRGVGPEFAKYYKDSETFTCISAPSIHLSVARLNDDFCDCPDGSDEPGTSACAHLSPLSPSFPGSTPSDDLDTANALPGYYCKNKGHQPSYVPFTVVNDGVCDYDLCCDGSDEWAKTGGVKCEDRCKEIGKEWRRQDEQRQKSLSSAARKRKEIVGDAERLRKEVEDRIYSLRTEIQGGEIKLKSLESDMAEAERQERSKVVKGPKGLSKMGLLAQLAKDRIEELRESLIEVRSQRDTGKARIAELEGILSTFKEEYNPNFNDEGVKRAVRGWEEYAARDKSAIGDDAHDRDLDEIAKPDGETGAINWSEWEEPEESDVDVLYKFEAYLPTSVRDWLDQKLRDLRIILVENGILAPTRSPDGESKELEDARNAVKAAQDSLDESNRQLTTHQEDLEKDYGADDVFRALKGQCISKDSGEYTYELCWLDKTKQKSKKGGSQTTMGNFMSFDRVMVDDEVPPDGKGLGSGERVALRYENGQHCWNGPNRSTLVVLACAEKDELWKITEEEKCVYRMEVGTPAVCGVGEKKEERPKDEL
ncbi:glucosidase II beta subunit-like protein-domain-containing protein [Usnea florida]